MTLAMAFATAMTAVIVPASASCASEIVYSGRTQGDQYEMYDVYKVDSETGAITQLTATTDVQESSPLWSPDRSRIAFWNMSGGDDLFVMNADGSDVRHINRSVREDAGFRRNPSTSVHLSGFDWSPSGNRLVYARSVQTADACPEPEYVEPRGYITTIKQDGSTGKLLTGTHGIFSNPDWSPDGRKILYTRQRTEYGKSQLMIMNSDGTDKRTLAKGNVHSYYYDWSPDSQWIAINVWAFNTSVLYILSFDGDLISVIDSDAHRFGPLIWSPDGSALAHQAMQGPDDQGRYASVLVVGNRYGENERRIVSDGVADLYTSYGYDWSPDSTSIVYVRNDYPSPDHDLHVVDVETGMDRALVQQPNWQTQPDW